ncbi:hypothetical protein LguiB_026470 [Lonicera macranthoides]
MALESLVAKSPYKTHAGGWISGYFRQRGRSSPIPHMEEYVKPSLLPQMLLWSDDVEKKF